MAEYFVSFSPMAYPPCRLGSANSQWSASQNCFTSFYDGLRNGKMGSRNHIFIFSGKTVERNSKISISGSGECITNPCPLQKQILYSRWSIGDLQDGEELQLFEQWCNIKTKPDYELHREIDIPLDSLDQQYEHQNALEQAVKQFERHTNCAWTDTCVEFMKESKQIAERIRDLRPASTDTAKTESTLINVAADSVDRDPLKSPTGEGSGTRSKSAERAKKVKKAAREYGTRYVNGEDVTREEMAMKYVSKGEPTALSKPKALKLCMEEINNRIEDAKKMFGGDIRNIDDQTKTALLLFICIRRFKSAALSG